MGGYTFYNPAQSLPQIISTSRGGANLAAIKQYFTDEQVIRAIAGYWHGFPDADKRRVQAVIRANRICDF